jgi:hypothetical protein
MPTREESTGVIQERTFHARGSAMDELDRRARAAAETQSEMANPAQKGREARAHRGDSVDASQAAVRLGEHTLLELIGPLDQVLHLAVTPCRLLDFPLDHRTAFLLAEIDGRLDVEGLVDVSGMPRLAALRILLQLLEDGLVARGARPQARYR